MNLLFLCLFCFKNYLILPLNMLSTYFFTKTQIIFAFRRDVKSSVQRLGQRVKYAWTSRSNSRASIGPYRMFVYQSIICLITNLHLKLLSQMTQNIICIRSINNIHWQLLDFFSFKLMFSLKSKNSSKNKHSHFLDYDSDVRKYFIFYNIAINTYTNNF